MPKTILHVKFRIICQKNMSICYIAITRNKTFLAQHAIDSGDFDTIVSDILSKSSLQNQRIQIDKTGFRFYIYHNKNGLNTVLACDQTVQSAQAFSILEHVYRSFIVSFPFEWAEAEPFEFQTEFEQQIIQIYESYLSQADKQKFSDKESRKKQSTLTSMQNALLQGDNLADLTPQSTPRIDKETHRSARWVQRRMFFQRFKYQITVLVILSILFVLFFILFIHSLKN